jgi:beta-lactamase regulating signal transducer with metallopeptidase domain
MNFAIVVLIKSSAILSGTLLFAVASKKASAAARHTIWIVGLLSILLLPVISAVLPELTLALRPDSDKAVSWITDAVAVAQTYGPLPRPTIRDWPAATHTDESIAFSLQDWLVLLWGLCASLIVIRFLMGVRDVRRLKRNSRPVLDRRWHELLRRLAEEFGVSSSIQLRIGGTGIPPMTWGVLRHTLLFPSSAAGWTEDRLRHAIAHELAHMKRRDRIVQLLVQFACSVYWFHPLVWYAAYRVRMERERACDDQVLGIGVAPEDYADDLLQIAREARSSLVSAGFAMTHQSGFATRVNAILDPKNKRTALSRRATTSFAGLAVLITMLLATLQLRALPVPLPLRPLPIHSPTSIETTSPIPKSAEAEKSRHIQTLPPRWAGVWRLNKQNSRFGSDPKIQEVLDSIDTITWTLEAIPVGMRVSADVVGLSTGGRQRTELTIPFGVRLNLKDLNPIAALLPPTSVLVTPVGNDSLQVAMNWLQTQFSQDLRIDVSSDGNTLTETLSPPDDFRIVFDKL